MATVLSRVDLESVLLDEQGNPDPNTKNSRYLKSANRAFSYLRTVGNISAMNKLQAVYRTDYLMMNQRQQMLDLIGDDALDPRFSSQRILTAAIAKQQIERAALDITPLATSKDLSDENQAIAAELPGKLRALASELRGSGTDPSVLTQPLAANTDLGKTLEKYAEDLSDLLNDAVSSYIKPIVINHVLLPFAKKSISVNGVVEAKSGVDFLIGIENKKDTFSFGLQPEFDKKADKILSFSIKDGDSLRFTESAFGLKGGTFAIAVGTTELDQQLGTDTSIIYFQDKGQLIRNANGQAPGAGEQGGVFALFLLETPNLSTASVSFIP